MRARSSHCRVCVCKFSLSLYSFPWEFHPFPNDSLSFHAGPGTFSSRIMFITKSQNLTLTLFVYIALVLSLTVTSEAHIQQRDHVNLKRLIKKRSPFPQGDAPLVPVAGAGAAVPSFPPTSSAASTSTSISATSTSVSQSTVSVSSTSTSSTVGVFFFTNTI